MWYFKGRRKKYKSPYTGKEVDESVGKAQILPDVSAENEGEFLRVNDAGKIVANKYPIERQTNVLYDENVSMQAYEIIDLVEYTNADNFRNLFVTINGDEVLYENDVFHYISPNFSIVLALSNNYITAECGDSAFGDVNINITEPLTIIDPLFTEGIEEVDKKMNVDFTKVTFDYPLWLEQPLYNAALIPQDILSLAGGNSVTKPLVDFNMETPRTCLIFEISGTTPSYVILNLNTINIANQLIYSGIIAIESSTAILSASVSRNGTVVTAVITATTIS